jgi:uncharacterized protein YdcH (DUF465 family)
MRIEQQALREALGYFWSNVFKDQDFLTGLTRSIAFRAQSIYDLENSLIDYMSRKSIPVFREWDSRLFFFDTAEMRSARLLYGEGAIYGSGEHYYGDLDLNPINPVFPIGEFTPKYLTTNLLDPDNVYQIDIDYRIINDQIVFLKNPLNDLNVDKVQIYDEETEQLRRTFQLWGFKSSEDIQALCDFYGTVAGVCSDSSDVLKEAINLAWDLRLEAVSDTLLKRTLSLISGVDYVHTGGVILDIYVEGDKVIVQVPDAVYTAPIGCEAIVEEGQTIVEGQEIFDAYSIIFPNQMLPEGMPEGIALGRGYIPALENSVLLPNKRVDIFRFKQKDWYEVLRINPTTFNKYNRDGNIIEAIPESEATAEIDAAPPQEYRFAADGLEQDLDTFFRILNEKHESQETFVNSCDEIETFTTNKHFFDKLADKYGKIPDSINPLAEFRDCYLNDNVIFLQINKVQVDNAILSQMLNILSKTVAAGSTFITLVGLTAAADENITSQGFAEAVEVFYIVDIDETDTSTKAEAVIGPIRI